MTTDEMHGRILSLEEEVRELQAQSLALRSRCGKAETLCYRADGLLATYQSGEPIDPRGWRADWKAARVGLG